MTSARKKFYRTSLLAAFGAFALMTGCDYSISENRNPITTTGCDTVNVSYKDELVTIFTNNCFACHNGPDMTTIDLSTYDGVKEVAESGQLLGAITHAEGFSAMPQSMDPLDSCSIAMIRSWIREGMLNN